MNDMNAQLNLKDFQEILRGYPKNIVEIAEAARGLVLDVLPGVYEVVWKLQGNTGYGIGPKKMTEHFCYISPAKGHVTFGFNYGKDLKDPHHLLEGEGLKFRHVKLRSLEDVRHPQLRQLVCEAAQERKHFMEKKK